jgi:hypothetical protein
MMSFYLILAFIAGCVVGIMFTRLTWSKLIERAIPKLIMKALVSNIAQLKLAASMGLSIDSAIKAMEATLAEMQAEHPEDMTQ